MALPATDGDENPSGVRPSGLPPGFCPARRAEARRQPRRAAPGQRMALPHTTSLLSVACPFHSPGKYNRAARYLP